jgi:hypothetical protein
VLEAVEAEVVLEEEVLLEAAAEVSVAVEAALADEAVVVEGLALVDVAVVVVGEVASAEEAAVGVREDEAVSAEVDGVTRHADWHSLVPSVSGLGGSVSTRQLAFFVSVV